jgi:hypothetical protein
VKQILHNNFVIKKKGDQVTKTLINKKNIWLMTLYILISAILLPKITNVPIIVLLIGDIPLLVILYYIFNQNKNYIDFELRVNELLIGLVFGITTVLVMIKNSNTYSLWFATDGVMVLFLIQSVLLIPALLILKKKKK